MKTEDYNRLKQLCDANGFELLTESPKENDKFFVVKKKDIWEGVEFAEDLRDNKIHLITNELTLIKDEYGRYFFRNEFKPSTESAYIEQLKRIAFEKFGEIKEGDRFDQSPFNSFKGVFKWDKPYNVNGCDFQYTKESDTLYLKGCAIYQQGKWATKLPERVKVEFYDYDYGIGSHYSDNFSIFFKTKNLGERDYNQIGQFLSQQLEEYLNKKL